MAEESNTVNKVLLGVAIACIIILGLMSMAYNSGTNSRIESLEVKVSEITPTSVPSANEVAQEVLNLMQENSSDTGITSSSEGYSLTKEEYEDQVTEEKAIELAMESLESRDFKKAVFDVLVAYGQDIESYKDITEIKVVDYDVDGDEIDFSEKEVKVYYFTDDDEDNEMKAYLDKFTIVIDDLDYDDNFEDAEVDEDYMDSLSVLKVKEI
jgi:hypothetical protein